MKTWIKVVIGILIGFVLALILLISAGVYVFTQSPIYSEIENFAEVNNLTASDIKEIQQGELEGLCEGFGCADYCVNNEEECIEFCNENPENSLCVKAIEIITNTITSETETMMKNGTVSGGINDATDAIKDAVN